RARHAAHALRLSRPSCRRHPWLAGTELPGARGSMSRPDNPVSATVKRSFDFLIALVAVILVSPVLLVLAVIIKLTSEGPVFYRGVRIGLHGQPFRIFKFRTMVIN